MMLRFKSFSHLATRSQRVAQPAFRFSTQVQPASQDEPKLGDLEQQALNIQSSINRAQANILEKTKKGRDLSLQISQGVQRDHFVKKQRYDIFITKMEQLQRADRRERSNLKRTVGQMRQAFVSSQQPLKDVLHYYNKAAVKGFDGALVSNTLEQIKLTMRARGNRPRVYDDYTTRELDLSWRMHLLADHIKLGLGDEIYFNHFHMANSARQLGEIGFKDVQVIQKTFDKLNAMLTERENGKSRMRKPLDIEKVLYGNYLNFMPKHYVYDGFESSQEFKEHLRTLLDWQNERADTLQNLEIEETEVVLQLEQSLSDLISASHQVRNMQVEMQASIDSLRTQFFKLQAASNKHAFLLENQHIHFDMLELQELLVKGGYLSPDEADKMSARHPHKVRMERAAEIFYDYVQNYAPELVSPQYDEIYDAAQSTLKSRNQAFEAAAVPLDEAHDKISLSSLSKALTGLSQQALSFRREANDQDYLHKFYEERAMKDEIKDKHALDEMGHLLNASTVRMARDYLKAYDIFDREVEKIWPRYKKLIKQSEDDLEGQLHCLLGLSRCKIEAPDLRSQIFKNIKKCLESKKPMRLEAAVDGLYGIALQNRAVGSKDVVSRLLDFLGSKSAQAQNRLSFQQKLEVVWSACALGFENKPIVRELYSEIQQMEFQRTDNDLTYEQFQLVQDFQLYLTKVSKYRDEAWVQAGRNEALEHLCLQPDLHAYRYEESMANFDPFKRKVLEALTRGLTMASIDHQSTLENNLFGQKQLETTFHDGKYPYRPDAIVGLGGSKVLLNVIPASETMRDIKKGDGRVEFRARITAGLQDTTKVQSMAVPITSVVDYDIANLKLKLNEKYNFAKDLRQQVKFSSKSVDFGQLSAFGAAFTGEAAQYLAALKAPGDKKRVDAFFKQLYHLFQVKQQTERQYETPVVQQGHHSMKLELMKLDLLWDSMPTHQKTYIGQFVPGSDFKAMISAARDSIQAKLDKLDTASSAEEPSALDLQWVGTRQTVELPQSAKFKAKKNIVPEIINQRFMWVDDYFHYEDWAETQKNVFDSFNLLVVPRQDNDFKWFYNRDHHHRIVPQGIFPPPNHKRVILQSGADAFANQTIEATERGNDALNEFEKEPFKTMVLKEQQRSQKMAALTDEVSFITNLQNIKQGLKQDYSDKQILDLILANLSFTDGLIEEHLGSKVDKQGGAPRFVARNAGNYREFVKSTYFSKDQEDPFTHFYIQESGKQERVHKTYRDQQEKYLEQMENAPTEKMKEGVQKVMQSLTTKIEDMLLQNRRENEDLTSLSHQLDSEVKIKYDLKSLMKSEYVYDIDPECVDPDISDAVFLRQQRKRAETKLIKTKIIYKMDANLALSENEKRYLQNWVSQLQTSCNVGNHRDSMLPQAHSGQKMGKALSAEDIFALNQIPNVQIQRKKHGDYALNDLVLELSHFLDEEVVNRVEMEIMSDRIRSDWKLPSDFKIIETRNKEIGITLNELEEVAWRMSGTYTDSEIESLKAMFSINRNKDSFDRAFYSSDMQSMENFVREVNFFDDRDQLIQEWLVRKEKEIQSRVNLPPPALRRTDQELHQQIDKKLKRAREKMVTHFLTKDEFGKKAVKKDYQDLTTGELARISESICVRLNLFDGQYPAFMPQAVRAVMDHPNLAASDRQKLDTFATMFELDWRGDRHINNKNEFLATNPVYLSPMDLSNFRKYGNIGNFEATTLLRLACAPFVEQLAQDMVSISKAEGKNEK